MCAVKMFNINGDIKMIKKTIMILFRKIEFILLIGYISLTSTTSAQFWQSRSLQGEIELKFVPYKDTFIKGENVYAEVKIRNITDRDVTVPEPRATGAIINRVTDMQENYLYFRGIRIERIGFDIDTLKPHEIRIENMLISFGFGNDTTSSTPFLEFIPGRYKSWVTLGDVRSNMIEFVVVEPPPDEDIVQQSFKSGVIYLKNPGKQFEKTIHNAKELIRQYPKSIYLPQIYSYLITSLSWCEDQKKKSDEIISLSMSFLDSFPDDPETETIIYDYARGLRIKLEKVDKIKENEKIHEIIVKSLNKFKSKYPNMRIARYADKEIRKLEIENRSIR